MHFGPHARAIIKDCWVPLNEILESNLLVVDDLATRDAFGNPMKFGAVCHHSWLRGLRRCNTISRTRGGGGGYGDGGAWHN